ncbi:MAG TPA: DUF1932 domain-containing protein [bacterium]|nr:DUF1932 domain-containing protein [bacterium]
MASERICTGQWSDNDAKFVDNVERRVRQVSAKAWRYVGEMEEIAATFRGAGLPGEFHEAAAMLYRRLAPLKEARNPALADVLAAVIP